MSIAPIAALPSVADIFAQHHAMAAPPVAPKTLRVTFASMIEGGIETVDAKAKAADASVRSFILDDSVPVHQVSFALEQARLSLELMLQVRSRMVEGYQQLMNMQL